MTSPGSRFIRYKRSRFSTRLPVGHRYTRSHYWLDRDDNGRWRIGLTTFAIRMLGDLVECTFVVAPGESVALDELLGGSDFVSVHTPLSEQTAGMFDARAFAAMRPHAVFVNTARGGVVDQPALREALIAGKIAAAALDVTTPEPLPPDDPLLEAPHLLVTPHVGSATGPTRERMAGLAVDGLLAALAGERPQHLVNPEARGRRE